MVKGKCDGFIGKPEDQMCGGFGRKKRMNRGRIILFAWGAFDLMTAL